MQVQRIPDPAVLEALQLNRDEQDDVIAWVTLKGYQLITEDLDDPVVTNKYRPQISTGKKMCYVNQMGQLVLMHGHFASNASQGDWIIYHGEGLPLQVMKQPAFEVLYREV